MPSHRVVSTASTIRDVAGGAAVVLELIERNMLDAEASDDAAPLLSPIHQGALMRLVVSAFRLVEREAIELQELAHSTPTAGQRSPSAATAEGGAS